MNEQVRGKFISFEGPDGAGKTSVLRAIQKRLVDQLGADRVMYTREPGGNHISEQIRRVLFSPENTDMDGRTEALLFAAARRQHIVSEIVPGLRAGKVILCDRYVDSSIAYQGAGRQLGEEAIWQMNQFAIDGLLPDLTIYLEKLAFHQTVRAAYLRLYRAHPDRIKLIDASQPLDQVIADVAQTIEQRFPDRFE